MRRATISSLVAVSLAAGLAGHADAAGRPNKKRLQASHYSTSTPEARYRKPGSGEEQHGTPD
jgi:hypothetical protein